MSGVRKAPTVSCEIVYPSGAADFAIAEGPSIPPKPGLFSTMIGCPRCFAASSASLRRCVSVDPPAGHGTISVIGRVG